MNVNVLAQDNPQDRAVLLEFLTDVLLFSPNQTFVPRKSDTDATKDDSQSTSNQSDEKPKQMPVPAGLSRNSMNVVTKVQTKFS